MGVSGLLVQLLVLLHAVDALSAAKSLQGLEQGAVVSRHAAHAAAERQLITFSQPLGYSPPQPSDGIPGFTVLQHVPGDKWSMPGGWYALSYEYKLPAPDSKYLQKPYSSYSCVAIGKQLVKQPMTDMYRRRHAPPTALPGDVPRVVWRWQGLITRQQFDAVPDKVDNRLCPFCLHATKYQIIDGHLYRKGNATAWAAENKPLYNYVEDMLLTILHLWDMPDMDFIVHNGAGCPPEGWPMISWNICRHRRQGGFGFPYTLLWREAIGPVQDQAFHQCMVTRYNFTSKRPVAFWRGSTTDPNYGVLNITRAYKAARIRMHKMVGDDPDFDAKIDRIKRADACTVAYLQPLGDSIQEMEHYARAAIALDLDGHGMSGRFGHRFVHYATPVLKQASNNTAFFEHLMAPGFMAEYFENDLSDLQARAHQLVHEWITTPARLMHQATQLQGFATTLMHQVALAEAAAYSLLMYSKHLAWKTVRDPTYTHIPFSRACGDDPRRPTKLNNRLPAQLCAEMQARPPRP